MANQKRGYFITLEGPDGSGKSTQFKLLVARLKLEGYAVAQTREPGGHPLAEKIRLLLLSQEGMALVPEAELLLFLAARAQHVREVILPAMQNRQIVVCDRFSDSTHAYQVGGRRLPAAYVKAGDRFATGGLKPDLTLLYDLAVDKGKDRAYQAKQGYDRIESESSTFLEQVRRSYLQIARQNKERIKIIRADQSLELVTRRSWQIVQQKMPLIRERCRAL